MDKASESLFQALLLSQILSQEEKPQALMCWLCQKVDDLTGSLEATIFKSNTCTFYSKTHLGLSHKSNIPLSIYILSGCRHRVSQQKSSYPNLIIFTRARRLLDRQREVREFILAQLLRFLKNEGKKKRIFLSWYQKTNQQTVVDFDYSSLQVKT